MVTLPKREIKLAEHDFSLERLFFGSHESLLDSILLRILPKILSSSIVCNVKSLPFHFLNTAMAFSSFHFSVTSSILSDSLENPQTGWVPPCSH